MLIDISLLKGGNKKEILIQEDLSQGFLNSPYFKGIKFLGCPKANLRATIINSDVLIKGVVQGDVLLICSRCLKELPYTFVAPVEEIFTQRRDLFTDSHNSLSKEKELSPEEAITNYYSGNTVDLTGVLQQDILLSLPIKPLCSEACKGLCESCGANLNEVDCGCNKEQIDPRWEVLKKLKSE